MRKTGYIILVLLMCCAQALEAAPVSKRKGKKESASTEVWEGADRNIHHIAIWGGGGYSGLLNGFSNSQFVGGGGGMIGVGYEYRYSHFILQTGPEFRIFTSQDKVSFPYPYDVAMLADGYNQAKHYTFASPFEENHLAGQVLLPFLMGGKWDIFYFLGGVKIGYTVIGNYSQKGTYSTSITDYDAQDPIWANMPNHGAAADIPYTANGSTTYGLDVALSAEAGISVNGLLDKEWNDRNYARKFPFWLRAAIFADYGLMNLTPSCEGPMAMADEKTITTRSLHTSDWAEGRLNSLLVGLKITALLQMNKPEKPKPKNPVMVLYVTDAKTHNAVAAVTVDITPLDSKKPRTTHRATNKNGMLVSKMAAGAYSLNLSHPDYIAQEHEYSHADWGDTLRLAMTPRPEFRFWVRDAKSDSLLAAAVTFVKAEDGTQVVSVQTDSMTGSASLRLPLNTPLRIHLEAANHLSLTLPVSNIGGMETYRMEPIVKKRAIILHNLFFATNETQILPESESAMKDLYDLLEENPGIRIRITGHTDNVGSDQANQILSEGRANSVREDLIRRGISADRIEAEGKGESQPIDTNDTEEGRQNNRRVEFMIL